MGWLKDSRWPRLRHRAAGRKGPSRAQREQEVVMDTESLLGNILVPLLLLAIAITLLLIQRARKKQNKGQ